MSMLYPTLDSLVKKVGSRYLLVNVTAKRAREIAEGAADAGEKLNDKPVRLAVLELSEKSEEEVAADIRRYKEQEDGVAYAE